MDLKIKIDKEIYLINPEKANPKFSVLRGRKFEVISASDPKITKSLSLNDVLKGAVDPEVKDGNAGAKEAFQSLRNKGYAELTFLKNPLTWIFTKIKHALSEGTFNKLLRTLPASEEIPTANTKINVAPQDNQVIEKPQIIKTIPITNLKIDEPQKVEKKEPQLLKRIAKSERALLDEFGVPSDQDAKDLHWQTLLQLSDQILGRFEGMDEVITQNEVPEEEKVIAFKWAKLAYENRAMGEEQGAESSLPKGLLDGELGMKDSSGKTAYALARFYKEGIGTQKDENQAKTFLKEAYDVGNADARYDEAMNHPPDEWRIHDLEKATVKGHKKAYEQLLKENSQLFKASTYIALGDYLKSRGDLPQAETYYKLANEKEPVKAAIIRSKNILLKSNPTETEKNECVAYFLFAAKRWTRDELVSLPKIPTDWIDLESLCELSGLDTIAPEKREEYICRAAEKGNQKAFEKLEKEIAQWGIAGGETLIRGYLIQNQTEKALQCFNANLKNNESYSTLTKKRLPGFAAFAEVFDGLKPGQSASEKFTKGWDNCKTIGDPVLRFVAYKQLLTLKCDEVEQKQKEVKPIILGDNIPEFKLGAAEFALLIDFVDVFGPKNALWNDGSGKIKISNYHGDQETFDVFLQTLKSGQIADSQKKYEDPEEKRIDLVNRSIQYLQIVDEFHPKFETYTELNAQVNKTIDEIRKQIDTWRPNDNDDFHEALNLMDLVKAHNFPIPIKERLIQYFSQVAIDKENPNRIDAAAHLDRTFRARSLDLQKCPLSDGWTDIFEEFRGCLPTTLTLSVFQNISEIDRENLQKKGITIEYDNAPQMGTSKEIQFREAQQKLGRELLELNKKIPETLYGSCEHSLKLLKNIQRHLELAPNDPGYSTEQFRDEKRIYLQRTSSGFEAIIYSKGKKDPLKISHQELQELFQLKGRDNEFESLLVKMQALLLIKRFAERGFQVGMWKAEDGCFRIMRSHQTYCSGALKITKDDPRFINLGYATTNEQAFAITTEMFNITEKVGQKVPDKQLKHLFNELVPRGLWTPYWIAEQKSS